MNKTLILLWSLFFYLLIILFILVYIFLIILKGNYPEWLHPFAIPIICGICGGFGGILYCMRGIYLNYCVRKCWENYWHPWYIIRPFASIISGGISFIFLKVGLFFLESSSLNDSTHIGFYALAFIAGLNVDKFISKIEDVAQATWGIEKSRSSKGIENAK